jgi:hypothetical protein
LIPALQIAEIMMEKLPETFSKLFVREGVVHAVESLICPESSDMVPSQVLPHDKDNESVMPSRSRRQRRRGAAAPTENSSLDESNTSNPGIASSTPCSTEVQNTSLRFAVSDRAKSFKDKYFPSDHESRDLGVTDDLLKLRTLCAKLNSASENVVTKAKGKSKALSATHFDISHDVEAQFELIITQILTELSTKLTAYQHLSSLEAELLQHCLTICPVGHLERRGYLRQTCQSFVSRRLGDTSLLYLLPFLLTMKGMRLLWLFWSKNCKVLCVHWSASLLCSASPAE